MSEPPALAGGKRLQARNYELIPPANAGGSDIRFCYPHLITTNKEG
jgi:hypothetical protein